MRPNVLIQRLPSLVALVAIAGATGCADERKGPSQGSLDGKCYPNGTCDPGLICQASGDTNICVEGPPEGTLGGACFGNGECYDGLVCSNALCIEDTSLPVGTLGAACFPNGTCNSSDLICVANLCEVNANPRGSIGGTCYANGSCNPGLMCVADVCEVDDTIPSGTIGGACLVNGTCNAGLRCNGTVCEVDDTLEVGTAGAACFPNGTCNAGLECIVTVTGNESHAECAVEEPIDFGALNQPCWPNGTCNGGLVCDLGTCVPSGTQVTVPHGQDGGLCYANGTCDDGLVCNHLGACEPIVAGGLNGQCIDGSGCNLGLSCYGGTCLPTVEHLGSIHGIVTDYTTNARLANVRVTIIHKGAPETSTSDALGYYEFDDLSPGTFRMTFEPLDGTHTIRRLTHQVSCDAPFNNGCCSNCGQGCAPGDYPFERESSGDCGCWWDQDEECNTTKDLYLFPFTGTETGKIWYVNDEEVVPAAGITVVADFGVNCGSPTTGGEGNGDQTTSIDISPDRFITTTDETGRFTFTNIPNTGNWGVRVFAAPSTFNGFDYESKAYCANLDIFDHDKVEIFLAPTNDPPFLTMNNWEDYRYGDFDVTSAITMTFSRSMKPEGCRIGLGEVEGTLEWSADFMTATFTPAEALSTGTEYTVTVSGCESAIDDQLFTQANACGPTVVGHLDGDCLKFRTQDGIQFEGQGFADEDACGEDWALAPDGNLALFYNMPPDLTVDGTVIQLFRNIRQYPTDHTSDDPKNTWTTFPIASTATVDGTTLIVDPAADLVIDGNYTLVVQVASSIPGDWDTTSPRVFDFCVRPADDLAFWFADIPLTGNNEAVLLDPTANITLTFSKDINAALTLVTIENADGWVDHDNADQTRDLMTSVFTVDGSNVILNPAEDLIPGEWYTIRYDAVAADGAGRVNGYIDFKVNPLEQSIVFVDSNLEPVLTVNYLRQIFLDFSNAIELPGGDALCNIPNSAPTDCVDSLISIVDEDGNELSGYTIGRVDTDDGVEDGRLVLGSNSGSGSPGWLKPNTTYTIFYKIYVDMDDVQDVSAIGTYVQGQLTFTTQNHITLVSTTVGTYTDSNNDGFYVPEDCDFSTGDNNPIDCGDFQGTRDFPAGGTISLTFTVPPEFTVYHSRNFVRLYRYTGGDMNATSSYDLVATTPTPPVVNAANSTVTLSLIQGETLQDPGAIYCIAYQLTSNIVLTDNDGIQSNDLSENVGGATEPASPEPGGPTVGSGWHPQFCFQTTTPDVAPPTAPTAAPLLVLVTQVDSTDVMVHMRHSVLQGAPAGTVGAGTRWYEYYASAEDGNIDDYLLWAVVEDCQLTPGDDCTAAGTALTPADDGTARPGLAVLGQDVGPAPVCNGGFGAPSYCEGLPFQQGQSVFYRVRACTGSVGSDITPLCGPFSAALEVTDQVPPDLLVYVLGAEGDEDESIIAEEGVDDSCDGDDNDALTFNVFGFASLDLEDPLVDPEDREVLGGAASIVVRQGGSSAPLAGITCAPIVRDTGTSTALNNTVPLPTPASYTSYAPNWYTANDPWPDWVTDANGWNTQGITMFDHRNDAWMYFPPLSVVSFRCTVPTGTNPLGNPGGNGSTINITASDTSGNSKTANRPVPAGDQCPN